ncbi:pilin [Haloarcula sp. JP-L23]|uniref:pilin n=1 Tax=Haloarcula sp. JP-L23 TaxID=2716717 RepID=UPI001D041A7D
MTASPCLRTTMQLALVVVLCSGPALAQSDVGSVYCGTPVETGISVVFSALAALGLPAGMFFTGRSGLAYMRSTGNPNAQNQARRDLILSGIGLGVVIMALVAPEIVAKFGNEIGFSFSECVTPFAGSSS